MTEPTKSVTPLTITHKTTSTNGNNKTEQSKDVNHTPPPTGNKIHENTLTSQIAESSIKIITEKSGDNSQRINTEPLRILHENRGEKPSRFARFWMRFGMRGKPVDEEKLNSFKLSKDDETVNMLLKGQLDRYETRRVLDRVRYLGVFGGEKDRMAAGDVLKAVRGVVNEDTGTSFFRRFTREYKTAAKIRQYYADVRQQLADQIAGRSKDVVYIPSSETAAMRQARITCLKLQLSVDDRLLLMDQNIKPHNRSYDPLEKLFPINEMNDIKPALSDDSKRVKLLDKQKENIKEKNNTFRMQIDSQFGLQDEIVKASFAEVSKETIEDVIKENGRTNKEKLYTLLNLMNEKLIEKPDDEKVNDLFDVTRRHPDFGSMVAEYCEKRLEKAMEQKNGIENPIYTGTVSLRNIICKPMLDIAIGASQSEDVAEAIRKNFGVDSYDYYRTATPVNLDSEMKRILHGT